MDYLSSTNTYYSDEKLREGNYNQVVPNPEETVRFSAIVSYLGRSCALLREEKPLPRILDLGCGRGWLTNLMTPFGDCEGIEPAEGAVRFAREHFPHLTFYAGTVDALLAKPDFKAYDVVVCSEVLEHVPQDSQTTFINQISSVLGPSGYCILTTPRGDLFKSWKSTGATPQPIEQWVTERQLRHMFDAAGFFPIEHTRVLPVEFSTFMRSLRSRRLRRGLSLIGLESVACTLDYMASLYQVWWLRKRTN